MKFHTGKGEYVDQLWCSLDTLTGGVNALTVRMTENGGMFVLCVCVSVCVSVSVCVCVCARVKA